MARAGYIIHGSDPDDILYINEDARKCASCGEVNLLKTGFDLKPQNEVSLDCRWCIDRRKELIVQKDAADADRKLTEAVVSPKGRRVLLEVGKSSADALMIVAGRGGRYTKTFRKVRDVIDKAMEHPDLEIALNGAKTLLGLQAAADRQNKDAVDISSLSDEERVMILMGPAKQLILTSVEFREELLRDPEIRASLLGTAGVDLLVVSPNSDSR